MQHSSIFLNRGRKRIPLIRDVTPRQWHTFINNAMEGLDENGRQFRFDPSVDVDDCIVVYTNNERPLYTLTLESD